MSKAMYFRTKKNKDNPFVMMDKRPIENAALSWKAKGILAYLLSRPDNWEIWIGDLVKRSTDGESSVRAGLKELRTAGHLVYLGREREEGQVKRAIWEVHEVPIQPNGENQHQADEPDSDFPNQENPNQENPVHTNTDLTETDLTDISTHAPKKPPLTKQEYQDILEKGKRDMDAILAQQAEFEKQEIYVNRTQFPAGIHRDYADVYNAHTGQQPKTKNQVSFWMSTFTQWNDAGYSVKCLDIALRYAKAQKPQPLTITHPQSLSTNGGGIMAMVDGELAKGNEFKELFENATPKETHVRGV